MLEQSAMVYNYLKVENKPRRLAMIYMRKFAPSHYRELSHYKMLE